MRIVDFDEELEMSKIDEEVHTASCTGSCREESWTAISQAYQCSAEQIK